MQRKIFHNLTLISNNIKIKLIVHVSALLGNFQITVHFLKPSGRAIAQAVSFLLPTAAARVQIRVWSCGIL
jgi:hypothetical protein